MENEGNDPLDNEKVQEAMDYADEAEEFAELAKELEEEIRELFDESGLDEEDYEEFKEGLLDELFGEESEFGDEISEQEQRMKEKSERRLAKMKGRGTIRCVNWETGEIKSYPENQEIGDTWIQITSFFSPFETPNGKLPLSWIEPLTGRWKWQKHSAFVSIEKTKLPLLSALQMKIS